MLMKKTRLILMLLGCIAALPLPAQEQSSWFRKAIARLVAPPSKLDTAAVYQHRPHWSVALTGELHQTGMVQSFSCMQQGRPVSLSSSMKEGLYTGPGLTVGYGGLVLGYTHQVGQSAVFSRSASLGFYGSGLGFGASYYDIHQPMRYTLTLGEEGDADYEIVDGITDDSPQLKMIVMEALYALNRKDFSYAAAFRGNQVQRRSAGSFMLSAKYLQCEVQDDGSDAISNLAFGLTRQAASQLSLGAGYSYNFVALHRQGADEKSLRNLTFNLTALPLLSVYNREVITHTITNPATGVVSSQTNRLDQKLNLNYVVQGGVGFTWSRYFLNLTAQYDELFFHGSTKIVGSGMAVDIKTAGRYNKWSAALWLQVRF